MKSKSPGADQPSTASLSTVPTPVAPEAASDTARLPASQEAWTEQRYIRLPDALYALRYRYPSVTESVFLECTRCHQWVAVPTLREIPNEVGTAVVSSSVLGLDSIIERTSSGGPLRHTHQDVLRRREELSNDVAAPQWRSRRLQEKHSHIAVGDIDQNGSAHNNGEYEATVTSQRGFFESILQQLRRKRRTPRDEMEDSAILAPDSALQTLGKHAPLYIPNPDTFICAGWQCAFGADALADLRRDWMKKIYSALPMPPIGEDSLPLSSDGSSSSSLPRSPLATCAEALRRRKAALNEALARELNMMRSRRGGRITSHAEHDSEHQDNLPTLSLLGSPAESETELSRMQGSWVRAAALHLLRSSGSGSGTVKHSLKSMVEEKEDEASRRRRSGVEEDSHGNVLAAYCWAVCDACGKLRRVAQPFPGGAPFVCAMAVTSSSSCRAARSGSASGRESTSGHHNACCVSEMEGLMQCNMKLCEAELIYAALSSPFLPYPLKAQVASLSRQQTCAENPGKPAEPLSRAEVMRVLLAEPLLRTIRASVCESAVKGTPHRSEDRRRLPSTAEKSFHENCAAESDDPDATLAEKEYFLYRSLPILRELARTIKARSRSVFVRQLQLTPAQIRAKREAVMRNSFLVGHQHTTTPSGGSGNQQPKDAAVTTPTAEVETAGVELKLSAKNTASTGCAEGPSRSTRARRAAQPSVPLAAPTPVGEGKESMDAARGMGTSPCPSLGKSVPTQSGKQATREAAPLTLEHPQSVAREVAQQVRPQPSPIAPRKRGRPPRQQPDEPARPEAPAEHATAATTTVAPDVKTAPPRRRRQRCEDISENETVTTESNMAAGEKAEAAGVVASPPAPLARRPPPGGGPSRRRSDPGANDKGSKAKAAKGGDWEVVHWVQCDVCKKWRIVPKRVPTRVKFWECKMRYHEEYGRATTCDDPDDAELSS